MFVPVILGRGGVQVQGLTRLGVLVGGFFPVFCNKE